jgi:hypothetical protein
MIAYKLRSCFANCRMPGNRKLHYILFFISDNCRNNAAARNPGLNAGGQHVGTSQEVASTTTRSAHVVHGNGRNSRPPRVTTTTRRPLKLSSVAPTLKQEQPDDEYDNEYDSEDDDVVESGRDTDRKYRPRFVADDDESSGDGNIRRHHQRPATTPSDGSRPKHVVGGGTSPLFPGSDDYVDESFADPSPPRPRDEEIDHVRRVSPEIKRHHGVTDLNRRRDAVTTRRTVASASASLPSSSSSSWQRVAVVLCWKLLLAFTL